MESAVPITVIKLTLGDIKGVETQLTSVSSLGLHSLQICLPGYLYALFHKVSELSLQIVGICAMYLDCFGSVNPL